MRAGAALPPRPRRGWRPVLGPILLFRGIQNDRWRVSAVFAAATQNEPPDLTAEGVLLPIPPRHLGALGNLILWRFDFALVREDADRRVAYGFATSDSHAERWWIQVPARDGRLRLAALAAGAAAEPGGCWARLNGAHRANPFHLMLRTGGQADAQAVWTAGPLLAAWSSRPVRERAALPFTPEMAEEAAVFALGAHERPWRRPELAGLHATLPAVMVPGAADRGENWETLPDALARSPVVQGVLAETDRAAAMLQAGLGEGDPPGGSLDFDAGGIGLLGLEAHRGPEPLDEPAWRALSGRLERLLHCRLLLVLCSPPPLEPRPGGIGSLLRAGLPLEGRWRAEEREIAWMPLLRVLGDHAHRSGARVALVAGGWGLAGLAMLRGPDHEICQLTLPAMDGQPAIKRAEALERAVRLPETIRDGLVMAFEKLPEGGDRHFHPGIGWASLETDRTGDLLVEWLVEDAAGPLIRWIPAISRPS